jgi:hypothetical protein
MVAATADGRPGPAGRTGLRQAAAVPAPGRRLGQLGRLSSDGTGEGQYDGVVVRARCHRGEGSGGDGRLCRQAVAGQPTQGRRDSDADGDGSERGDGVAGAPGCLIGSSAVGRNCRGRPGQ